MNLEGKSAIVTGGGAGIGKEIVAALAEAGAKVTIADLRPDLAESAQADLARRGLSVDTVQVDVSRADQVSRLVETVVERSGGVDILVNNVGLTQVTTLLETTEDEWDTLMDVNLKGPFLCSKAAVPVMIRQGRGGRIINTVSTAAANARVGASAYCASKAGLVQLTKVMALELGPHGITVNAVGPGLAITDSPVRDVPSEEYQRAFIRQVPLGRGTTPRDIASTMAFLASPDAEYITGQVIYVDGGYSAGKFSVRG